MTAHSVLWALSNKLIVHILLIHFSTTFYIFSGENSIVVVKGANDYLTVENVDAAKDLIQKSKILLCNLEIDPKVTLHALKMAKSSNGKHTMANPYYPICTEGWN